MPDISGQPRHGSGAFAGASSVRESLPRADDRPASPAQTSSNAAAPAAAPVEVAAPKAVAAPAAAGAPAIVPAAAHAPNSAVAPATNAPSSIGALAASLQAIELQKLLAARGWEASLSLPAGEQHPEAVSLVGRELFVDAYTHTSYLTTLHRNAACLFDHQTWEIEPIDDCTIGEVLDRAPGIESSSSGSGSTAVALDHPSGIEGAAAISVEGDAFLPFLRCACGYQRTDVWRLRSSHAAAPEACPLCARALFLPGFFVVDSLSQAAEQTVLDRRLSSLGLRPGDVFSVGSVEGGTRHFELEPRPAEAPPAGATVLVAGCGNIGSHLISHVARMGAVSRLIVCDHDVYESRNLSGQELDATDVGRGKALVQAERARAIRPELDVLAFAEPLERVPFGHARGAILIGCLDSRAARQSLNQLAWRVNAPWIDAAVDGERLLARASVYVPGQASPCIECGWDFFDYSAIEAQTPCLRLGKEKEHGPAADSRADAGGSDG